MGIKQIIPEDIYLTGRRLRLLLIEQVKYWQVIRLCQLLQDIDPIGVRSKCQYGYFE